MNERIKELIKQAQVNDLAIDTNGDPYDVKRLDPEKFAELIVKECLHIVDDEGAGEGGCIRAMIRIQEEFGVEA